MKRIIFSLAVIAVTTGALLGGTTAFFSDVETSTANTFTAGALDLKVDNESYYNGNLCAEVTPGVWQWQGESAYPVPGTPCTTSWNLDDLDMGHLFFEFTDVKPDDEGEDTISLHVQNDAWACMDLTLTTNDDVSSNEPELGAGDVVEDGGNLWDGELAQNIEMLWWADDGDNVYETGEPVISEGVQSLINLASTTGAFSVAIADSANNVWGTPGPLSAEETVYLAKSWCFGTLVPSALPDDADTGPLVRGTGVNCDGTGLGNLTQTDRATLDVQFRTEQARHNKNFLCTPREVVPENGTITVVKVIEGGNAVADDFSFVVDLGSSTPFEVDGTNVVSVAPGIHDVVEVPAEGYSPTYANSLNGNTNCDDLLVPSAGNVTCTITNAFTPTVPTTITVEKTVVGGTATSGAFTYRIDGNAVPLGSNVVTPGVHTVTETDGPVNYVATFGGLCNASGTITAVSNTNVTCSITNTFVPPATTTILTEGFGTGDCLQDIPGWDEDPGEACPNGTVAADIGTGDSTASPDGGRFALIGNNGYICRTINATGLQNLQIGYYWRGDSDAEAGDNGLVTYATGGTCASPTGTTTVATHPLTTTTWQSNMVNLPASLNNTVFFARFFSGTNQGAESFRMDGLSFTGTPI